MTQEEKELLLKDLCARLPYGLVINIGDGDLKLDRQHQGIGVLYPEDCSDEFNERHNNSAFYITISGCYYGEDIKPYLRPISSMTEEEQFQLGRLTGAASYNMLKGDYSSLEKLLKYVYKNHIDYFNLIPMDLALEAPEGMYTVDALN